MRQFDHIIWDWNGTIVDDTELCLSILNGQLQLKGMEPLDLDTYRSRFKFPVSQFYKEIGFTMTQEDFEIENLHFMKEYDKRRLKCTLHKNIKDVLQQFVDNGGTHSILSAYSEPHLLEMVTYFKINSYFTKIFGLDHIYASSKTDKGLELIGQLGIKKSRIVMVGDTTHDYEVATAMGIQCFLIPKGHQSVELLSECKAVVLESHSELLSYL